MDTNIPFHDELDNTTIQQLIVDNYIDSWRTITRTFDERDPRDLFGIDGFITGVPYMMMNSLFDGPENADTSFISDVIRFYKKNQLPLMWFITPQGINHGIDIMLDNIGMELASMQVPGMAIDLNHIDKEVLRKNTREGEFVKVNDDHKSHHYTEIFMKSFEIDPTIQAPMQRFTQAFVDHPKSTHFLLEVDDRPVTTASVIYDAGVAGIYNVATLPDYRGRGLATAVLSRCLLDAIDRGYRYSILHSSSKGKGVYERLGYRSYFVFKRYLLRPTDVGL